MERFDDGGLNQQKQPQRRRSASELRAEPSAPAAPAAAQDEWLHEELEAVGELKRGAIAAQFPEEFSVDSDFLNGASNVWLPARLHPEIAPGEFQEWLKKHGSQLSKMEDTVNRRKSILSYSVDTGSDDETPNRVVMRNVRRRNTTGLMRRKTFIERATEEEEAAAQAGEEAPYLVQNVQRSSLKRSKLANKRRDSTASTGGSRRRGRRGQQQQPVVSSPLAPSAASDEDADGSSRLQPGQLAGAGDRNMSDDGKRMSTAEILKQVTAAVDDFGFDDFELNSIEGSGDDEGPPRNPPAVTLQPQQHQPQQPQQPKQQPQQQQPQQQPAAAERKTITHKKSGSWWQWGRDDNAEAAERDSRSDTPPPLPSLGAGGPHAPTNKLVRASDSQQQQQQPTSAAADSGSTSLKAKLPSPIAFLRFNRKSKKDRKPADSASSSRQPRASASPSPSASPSSKSASAAGPAALARSPTPHTAVPAQQADNDNDSDGSSETESPQPSLSASRPGPSSDSKPAGHSQIPSIIAPTRPPPTTQSATGGNRLPIHIERAIYRLASIKLANPRRPLLQQVLLSNMMFWYLELINPKTQQQQQPPQQQQQPPPQQQQQQQQSSPQQPAPHDPNTMQQQQQQQQTGMRSGSPVPFQPQQQKQKQKHHQQPSAGMRSGSPVPYQQHQQHQHQPQPQQQHQQGSNDRRGKRGNPLHKNSRDHNRRRSSNTSAGEQVVMRSPQYERQQQQIYMNGSGHAYGHQSPPTSPQSMQMQTPHQQQHQQHQQQRNSPYQNMAGARSQPSVSRMSQSDEDDDVPLALYRGERNAMSIG